MSPGTGYGVHGAALGNIVCVFAELGEIRRGKRFTCRRGGCFFAALISAQFGRRSPGRLGVARFLDI